MEHLAFERKGPIGILRVNRPESLNSLSRAVLEEMREFIAQNRSQRMRALILTGSGDKAFMAGADIKEMQGFSPMEMMMFASLGQEVSLQLEQAPFVTIAAVNGFCLGGGLELALSCDFIYASTNARFGLPEVTLGLIPGFGGTQRLTHAVGARLAKELIMTGKHIQAEEALRVGLVNNVVAPELLLDACEESARQICGNGFFAVTQAKHAVNAAQHLPIHDGLQLERNMAGVAFDTPDREEGIAAFIEKRTPVFA
ncbi:MAG: enoyl-CoA hydratase/isomerase family protein [Chlamydiia bacterium]|nr:enoyl-CoA hydratase/isomerase family protein [Chlamydiia bacterium]